MRKHVRHGTLKGKMLPEQQCTGKEPFANGAMAHRVAVKLTRKKKGGVEVYRCPHCGKFHIGGSFK